MRLSLTLEDAEIRHSSISLRRQTFAQFNRPKSEQERPSTLQHHLMQNTLSPSSSF
jgi:hypothetical protein